MHRTFLLLTFCAASMASELTLDIPFEETTGSGPFGREVDHNICPSRLDYRLQVDSKIQEEVKKKCAFCDEENIRKKNILLRETDQSWLILNKNPYTRAGYQSF